MIAGGCDLDEKGIRRAHFWLPHALASCLMALLLGLGVGCRSASTRELRRNRNIEPFNFKVSSGRDEFQIEGYLARPGRSGRWPTLLILDPNAGTAGRCITREDHFTQLGLNLACISLPGNGKSSGPGRFVGPQAVAATQHALDLLAGRPDVDRARMGVWGLGNGAVAAGLVMDRDERARVVILQSGTYDLPEFWPKARLLTKLSILHQVWPSKRVLKERSVIDHLPRKLDCKVLILHGRKDRHAPVAQAEQLAVALRERGAEVQTRFFTHGGDRLGTRVDQTVAQFLRQNLAVD
ncbi:MAG TPA: prolyl oligopeptidase family serine peptidase [Candidatus Binataceae bacterium]|nr:prolyl oligopeptidase family serine peptidase [Candidatus Binataceae bacterium]